MGETDERRYRNLGLGFAGIGLIIIALIFLIFLKLSSIENSMVNEISSLTDELTQLKENPPKTIVIEKHVIFKQLDMEEVNKHIEYLFITGYEDLVKQNIIEEFFLHKTKGMKIGLELASSNRVGSFLVKDCNKHELFKKIAIAMDRLEVYDIDRNLIIKKDILLTEDKKA